MGWQRAASQKSIARPDTATVRDAAIRLLAQREHSRVQLEQKLKRKFGASLDGEVLADVLDAIASDGLQCDRRYTEAKLRQRIGAGHGPLKLRADFAQAGVQAGLAASVIDEVGPDWVALASDAAHRKFGSELSEPTIQARCARFLRSRGFTDSQIRSVLFD